MREAVICEPVRTPIGRYGGMFKSLTAVDLGVAALKGLLERTGIEPAAVRRRHPRPLLSEQRGAGDRARGGAGRRTAGDRARHAGRPPLRVGPAGRHPGLPAGCQRRQRRCGRRRGREHEQCHVLLDGHALGWRPRRREGARLALARPHHRRRTPLSGAGRHAGDCGKPAPAVRNPAPGTGRACGDLTPAGGRRAEGRDLRRGDHSGRGANPPGRRVDRHRRAPPGRHVGRDVEQAETRSAGR